MRPMGTDEGHVFSADYEGVTMSRERYGFTNFIVDCILTLITGGLWLIWIFVREMRRR